jgi:hypothetical protein
MPYVFQVAEQTIDDCLRHSLAGVPGTLRAFCQFWNVRPGERCYFFVPRRRRSTVIGPFITTRQRWVERCAKDGLPRLAGNPWVDAAGNYRGRKRNPSECNFPYRMRLAGERPPGEADISLLEQSGILDRAAFQSPAGVQGRPCVVYIPESAAERIDSRLRPLDPLFDPGRTHEYRMKKEPGPLAPLAGFRRREDLLTWQLLRNPGAVSRALGVEAASWWVVDLFMHVTPWHARRATGHQGWAGEIDMLGYGAAAGVGTLFVIEAKAEAVTPMSGALEQAFGYWTVLRRLTGSVTPPAAAVLPVVAAERFPTESAAFGRMLSPLKDDPAVSRAELRRFGRSCLFLRILESGEDDDRIIVEADPVAAARLSEAVRGL